MLEIIYLDSCRAHFWGSPLYLSKYICVFSDEPADKKKHGEPPETQWKKSRWLSGSPTHIISTGPHNSVVGADHRHCHVLYDYVRAFVIFATFYS